MQVDWAVFLALLLGHLLGDFPFQTDRIIKQKSQGLFRSYGEHGLIHYGAAVASLAAFTSLSLKSFQVQALLVGLIGVHLLGDWGKSSLERRGTISDNVWTFFLDQVLRVGVVGMTAGLLTGSAGAYFVVSARWISVARGKLLVAGVVYAGVIFGGGHLVRYLTKPLLEGVTQASEQAAAQLRNAGMYIGWLERFVVLTALVLQSPATVGLVFTAKSIVRFHETKEFRFGEYFLIGTLLSLSLALLGGVILMRVFYGTTSLK